MINFTWRIWSSISGVIHWTPTWRRSQQSVQKLKKQYEHWAWSSSSSMQGVLHLGQFTISDIDSSVFTNIEDSQRSNSSLPSNCFSKPGGIMPLHFASGQCNLVTVPSLTCMSEKVFMHFQQKKCLQGSLINSAPIKINQVQVIKIYILINFSW